MRTAFRAWRSVAFALGVFLCTGLNNSMVCRAEEGAGTEVVILIDTSASMQELWTSVMEWTERIGVYSQDTGIKLRMKSFDVREREPGEIFYGEISSAAGNLTEYMDDMKGLGTPDGRGTDHLGAIDDAVEIMNKSSAKRKCIVILSDGKLDYSVDGEDGPARETEEKEAKKSFKSRAESFAEKDGQEIVLIGFGKELDLFRNMNGVTYISGDLLTDEEINTFLRAVFGKLDIALEEIKLEKDGEKYKFSLDEGYYRTIIGLRSENDEVDLEQFRYLLENENGPIIPELISPLPHSCYLYFSNLEKGSYQLTMPAGEWRHSLITQKKIEVSDIELSIEEDENCIYHPSEDVYCLKEPVCVLNIKVTTKLEEQLQELNMVNAYYVMARDGDKRRNNITGKNENGTYHVEAILDGGNGEYDCWVEIQQGTSLYKSNKIKIKVESDSVSDSESEKLTPVLNGSVDRSMLECIDLSEYFGADKENSDKFVYVGCEKVCAFGKTGTSNKGTCEYANNKIVFYEEGRYQVSLRDKDDSGMVIEFVIKDNRSWWRKIWDDFFGKKCVP